MAFERASSVSSFGRNDPKSTYRIIDREPQIQDGIDEMCLKVFDSSCSDGESVASLSVHFSYTS